jgi:hypothetical protein
MIWKFKNRPNSVLGLTLSDGQFRAVQVARSKDAVKVVHSASAALSTDLMNPKPELVGREIRGYLDAAKIHEHACVVEVPADWVMSLRTKIPALSPEDLDSLLQIEAEKGFPYDVEQLQITRSLQRSADGDHVTQLAVRKDRLDHLSAVLKAARLRPVSFPLGLPALQGTIAAPGKGSITVAVGQNGATLLVSAGGGISAFRTCEATNASEVGGNLANGDAVSRELRVTFEQVPADLRRDLQELSLSGEAGLVNRLADNLRDWSKTTGLEVRTGISPDGLPGDRIAEAIAANWLETTGHTIDFLPVRPGRWSLLVARYNSKRLATVGLAVGGAVALLLLAFGWQEFRLQLLRSEWGGMQAQVATLTGIQDRIRDYRPWYDRSFPDLRILARVTQCFPENGSVTARTFDIHHVANVTTVDITGTARDNRALLRTQDQLRKAKEIQGLKVESISGKIPAQFTFTFRWIGDSGS